MTQRPMTGSTGLTQSEAARRLAEHGPNEVRQAAKRSPWIIFGEQFTSPLVLVLVAACVLSAILSEWAEAVAIAAILLLNAVIGFFQEYRAETAVQALQSMTAPRAKVIRDGRHQVVPARDVVPGDLLLLEAGDLIAADGRIVESARLQVNEAVLTGESVPVEKSAGAATESKAITDRHGAVFMGTVVTNGTASIEIAATGMASELGKIAHLITTAEATQTPLQEQLSQVGRMLLYVCLIVVGVVVAIGIASDRPWLELLVFSVSLAVAAVPEGMPAIVTVALAIGVQRMAQRNALIRKLPSVEALGSVSVICTDKTGTLTTGKMRVREVWGRDHGAVVRAAALCCDAELDPDQPKGEGDPTEIAILIAARERGFEKPALESELPRVLTEPFDAERRRMSIARADGRIYVKGAVESLLPLCGRSSSEELEAARKSAQDLSARGFRVLAVAVGEGTREENLELVGLLGIADPPRTEVMQSIVEARAAGIRPVMITGDHPLTAAAIARELGLVLEGESLESRVHARATPEDKLKLVREWKSRGAIVAMTGDGVNDAPALTEAHVGIAMGITGTEVTRQSADLVLADDNFATIVAAVREGRGVYRNIRKAILYLLTGNAAELIVVLGASVLGMPLPLLAAHLLWINLVTDALPGLALIADPVSPGVMRRPPRPASERILGRQQWIRIAWIATLEAAIVLVVFWNQLAYEGIERARCAAFTVLVMSQLFRSFGARSRTQIFWEVGAFSNLWLLAVVAFTFALQWSLFYVPLTQRIFGLSPLEPGQMLWMILVALIPISVIELSKLARRLFRKPASNTGSEPEQTKER